MYIKTFRNDNIYFFPSIGIIILKIKGYHKTSINYSIGMPLGFKIYKGVIFSLNPGITTNEDIPSTFGVTLGLTIRY